MDLSKFSIRRPVFILSVVILMASTGIFSLKNLGVDLYPDVTFPVIYVSTPYPGAGPSSIEEQISKPLEEKLSSLAGLKRLQSQSMEGVSIVIAEFHLGTDIRDAETQVRARVDQARPFFPKEADKPLIVRLDPDAGSVVTLVLFADLSPGELYELADKKVRPVLERQPSVGSVTLVGGTYRQIQIDLDRNKLNAYRLSASQIANRVGGAGEDTPLGSHASDGQETTYRFSGEFNSLKEIENVIVQFGADPGSSVLLRNVAEIKDSLSEPTTLGFLYERSAEQDKKTEAPEDKNSSAKTGAKDSQSRVALFIEIYKKSGSNTVSVVSNAVAAADKLNLSLAKLPGKPSLTLVKDGAKPIRINIEDVVVTIILAIVLTMLVVYIFMGNVRSTLITGFAIPNSIIGAFILMYLMGFTINIMTLLALSLVVGLLVDDAIVVRENVFTKMKEGLPARLAAHLGTKEVTLAVVATSLTVIAVFLPMGFLSGIIGQFFKQFGLTVVFAIIISTFDGLVIAPMLSAYFSGVVDGPKNRLIQWFDRGQERLKELYGKAIDFSFQWRKSVLAATLTVFVLSVASMAFVRQTFLPTNETGEFVVSIELPAGSSLDHTRDVALGFEKQLRSIKEISRITTVVGGRNLEKHLATLSVTLVEAGERKISTGGVKDLVRAALKVPKGATLSVGDQAGGAKAFQLQLRGDDLAAMGKYADQLVPRLQKIPDLVDLSDDYDTGKPLFQVKLDPALAELTGVQPVAAGQEIRLQIAGAKVGKLRQNQTEYEVWMRAKNSQRNLETGCGEISVPNVGGRLIPLRSISKGERVAGPSQINRQDRSRIITISANLAPTGAIVSATDAAKRIIAKELPTPPGVEVNFAGQAEDMAELGANMVIAFGFGILFIYLVLAALYESFVTPVAILLAIPPALSGGFLSLFITGEMFNIFSMIAMIMLLGIVTKNSILLVDHAMQQIRLGMTPDEAMRDAGTRRLRPILMTAISMIAGTLPIAIGLGEAGKSRTSMGVAIIGGMIISTVITLVVVPILFAWIEKVRVRVESRFAGSLNDDLG